MVELDQKYVKSLLDTLAITHCKSMATPGSKGQESSRNVANSTEKLDPQEHREFLPRAGICQYMTEQRFDIACSRTEIMREAAGPNTASKTKLKRIARYQMSTGLETQRQSALRLVECWQSVRASQFHIGLQHKQQHRYPQPSQSCIESLHVKYLLEHQIARPFKFELWTDSSSAKTIMERLGPGCRAKHLEVQTMWVPQLNKIGLISLNKLGTLENVADLLTKHVPRAVLDKLAGMMACTFPDEDTQKFQELTSIN